MKFRPCIDLHNGRVKQIIGSSLSDAGNSARVNFESEHTPTWFAHMYARDGLRGGHVIKLGPGNEAAAREALVAWPQGFQLGGGITADNADDYLAMGASHVIVTSYMFRDGRIHFDSLDKLVAVTGPERLVLDLSCKRHDGQYVIVTDRWQTLTDTRISSRTLARLAPYCSEFLVHAASVEGLMQGPDLQLVKMLADYAPTPVVYAGGIATLEHIEAVRKAGSGRIDITIGSALDIFGGRLSYHDVVKVCI